MDILKSVWWKVVAVAVMSSVATTYATRALTPNRYQMVSAGSGAAFLLDNAKHKVYFIAGTSVEEVMVEVER